MDLINELGQEENKIRLKAQFVLKNVHLLPASSPLLRNVRRFSQQEEHEETKSTDNEHKPHLGNHVPTSTVFLEAVATKLRAKNDEISTLKLQLATSENRAVDLVDRFQPAYNHLLSELTVLRESLRNCAQQDLAYSVTNGNLKTTNAIAPTASTPHLPATMPDLQQNDDFAARYKHTFAKWLPKNRSRPTSPVCSRKVDTASRSANGSHTSQPSPSYIDSLRLRPWSPLRVQTAAELQEVSGFQVPIPSSPLQAQVQEESSCQEETSYADAVRL